MSEYQEPTPAPVKKVDMGPGIHESATIDRTARISPKATIGPDAVVGPGVIVEDGAVVGKGRPAEERLLCPDQRQDRRRDDSG